MSDIVSKLGKAGLQIAAGLLAVLLVWLVSLGRPWQAMEVKAFDLYTYVTAPRTTDLPIVILAIDEPTFQELQMQWPFPRQVHARLVERLAADGAAAIGFDVIFAEPTSPENDEPFARAIGSAGNVVLGASTEMVDSGPARIWTNVMPIKRFLEAGAVPGLVTVAPDDDFVVRRHAWQDDTLSARIGQMAGKAKPADSGTLMIEYIGPRGTFDTRSYYQALEPGLLPPGFFKDKIVLIGRSARSAAELNTSHADMFNSPFAISSQEDRLIPGVEIQATLLHNWMTDGGIAPLDTATVNAVTVLVTLMLLFVTANKSPGISAAVAALIVAGIAALSFYLFIGEKKWLSPLFPIVAVIAAYCATSLVSYAMTRRQALRVRSMFSQYVPEQVVAKLIKQPNLLALGGELREVTLMFTDLANFTTMSEQLSPAQTVDVLTEYFDTMTPIIHRYGGTVDKFIGDAIMAFWGAPLPDDLHAEHAVRAAIDMDRAMRELTQRLRQRGLPEISMRIGLHTGQVVVGNVGSQTRFSYTAVGDAVNLAARLEGANKFFGSSILISEVTASQLSPDIRLRPLDVIVVKGKTEPIAVFTPCEDAVLCRVSAEALAAFRHSKWKDAQEALDRVLARMPDDPSALKLMNRIQELKRHEAQHGETKQLAVALDKL